jgi:GxxExxY protein
MMTELLYKDEVYAVVGAAMEVHNTLGHGFLKAVYQEALEIECRTRGIPVVAQQILSIHYKGRTLRKSYVADFVAYDKIIVEIKAMDHLTSLEEAQVMRYLKASGLEVGLLINFGAQRLEWKRMIWTHAPKHS